MVDVAGWLVARPRLLHVPGPADVHRRRRLEQALHDEIAVGLSATLLQLDVLARAGDDRLDRARLDRLRDELRQAIDDARALGRVVFSPVLRSSGLAAAAQAVAEYRHLRLHMDLPDRELDQGTQGRIGLLVVDHLHGLVPVTGLRVRVRVRGRRLVRVHIVEDRPGSWARHYWAVLACA